MLENKKPLVSVVFGSALGFFMVFAPLGSASAQTPQVTSVTPAQGTFINGVYTFSASFIDPLVQGNPMRQISLYIYDGNGAVLRHYLGQGYNSASHSVSFDTRLLPNAAYQLRIEAISLSGSIKNVYLGFVINNASITPPPPPLPPPTPSNRAPVGYHDDTNNSTCSVKGWTYDPDVPGASIRFHVYVDIPPGSGPTTNPFIGKVGEGIAYLSRPDVNSVMGVTGNHGFSYTLPSRFRDGRPHTVYTYGIDYQGGANTLLLLASGTSQTIQCPALAPPPPPPTPTVPIFTSPTCGQTLTRNVGDSLSFVVAASNPSLPVQLNVFGLPLGATMTPGLPITGNQASSTFSWTPQSRDARVHFFTFHALSGSSGQAFCSVAVRVNGLPPPPPPPPAPPPGISPGSRPDVIVTSLNYANGIFTSMVKNQGTVATPQGTAIGVGYSVDGVYRTWGALLNSSLAPGASATIGTNGGIYTISPGFHSIRAWVDDANRFAESNETNNQFSKMITISSVTPPPTPPPPPGTSPLSISMTVGCAPNCPLNGTVTPVNVSVLSGTPTSMSFSRDGYPVFLTCPGNTRCYQAPAWGFNWCISISCWGYASGSHTLKVTARNAAGQTATTSVVMNVSSSFDPPSPGGSQFMPGDLIRTTAYVNVRTAPIQGGSAGAILYTQPIGALGTIMAGPITASGVIWWQIDYNTGTDGWSGQNYLVKR